MPGSLLPRRLPPVRLAPLGGKTSRRPAQHRLARAAPYRKPQPLRVRCGHLRCHVCETRGRGRGGAGQGGRRNGGENDAETRTEAGQPTPTPTPRMAWCLLALLALPRLAPRPPRPFPPSPRNRSPGRPFCAGQGFCETRRACRRGREGCGDKPTSTYLLGGQSRPRRRRGRGAPRAQRCPTEVVSGRDVSLGRTGRGQGRSSRAAASWSQRGRRGGARKSGAGLLSYQLQVGTGGRGTGDGGGVCWAAAGGACASAKWSQDGFYPNSWLPDRSGEGGCRRQSRQAGQGSGPGGPASGVGVPAPKAA